MRANLELRTVMIYKNISKKEFNEKIKSGKKYYNGDDNSCMPIFYSIDFSEMVFKDLFLVNAKFIDCNLNGAVFNNCNLLCSIFEESLLRKSEFSNCNLQNSRFSRSFLFDAAIRECDLTSANLILAGLNLFKVRFSRCVIDDVKVTDIDFPMLSYSKLDKKDL